MNNTPQEEDFRRKDYFRSLTAELNGLQNRVRQLIGDAHWPTDGAWKESILKMILRRHLPPTLSVGSGFIVAPGKASSQIDILVYDNSGPVLFRDGDLVVVTPQIVRGVIEVKTSLATLPKFSKAVKKLDGIAAMLPKDGDGHGVFVGLFAVNKKSELQGFLQSLDEANRSARAINAICIGASHFVRYWPEDPRQHGAINVPGWLSYDMVDLAPGYFIQNVLAHLFPEALTQYEDLWFPSSGKGGFPQQHQPRTLPA